MYNWLMYKKFSHHLEEGVELDLLAFYNLFSDLSCCMHFLFHTTL